MQHLYKLPLPKKKILFVHHTTAAGGATNSMLYNILGLPNTEYDVRALFLEPEKEGSMLYKEKGIPVDFLSGITYYQHGEGTKIKWLSRRPWEPITRFFKMLRSIPKMEAYLEANPCDIVYANTSLLLPVGIAAKRKNKKLVWHVREQIASGILGVRKQIVRYIIKKYADKIIIISHENAKKLGKTNKAEVVYNFVNFNVFDKDLPANTLATELEKNSNTIFITMLGGTVHSKGADVFIKAAPQVLKTFPNAVFAIAGYPPSPNSKPRSAIRKLLKKNVAEECVKLIKELNLKNKVIFIGVRKDIPQVIASSKIIAWPATQPHFARPIIEAQAMATPPVGTRFGSTKELISEKETGSMFPLNNHNALANAILLLLQNKELYNQIAENGYRHAKEKFNAEHNLKRVIEIIKTV